MNRLSGISGDQKLRLDLVELTKRLAPEKLGAVLESLSPVGLADLMNYQTLRPNPEANPSRSRGKELLEQALSIIK